MNLGELRTAVARRTGVAYDDTALTDVINEANLRISLEAEWPWLHASTTISATVDDGTEALPVGFRRVTSVTIDGYEAVPIAVDEIDSWDNVYSSTRRGYTVRGTDLLFRPTQATGTDILVRYIASEEPLTGSTDTPLMPEAYHDAIVDLASAIVLERVGQLARADRFERRYADWLARMKANAVRLGGRVGRIRVRPGGGV